MRLIDADKLPYEDIESVDGNTYMCVNAYDIEHAPTIEQSEDCISRQAALDTIGNVPDYDDGMVWEALSHAQRDVALLPSATPKVEWIPVTERLPEEHKWVLCSCRTSIYEVLMLTNKGWEDGYDKVYMQGFVVAWQPLPEPYSESDDKEVHDEQW